MKRAVLLEGNWFQCREILDSIKDHLGEYEFFSFNNSHSYSQVKQVMTEFSCFDTRRLIVINAIPRIEAPDKSQARTKVLNDLKKTLPKVPAGTLVVLNNLNISTKSFHAVVKKMGSVHIFDKSLRKGNAATWIVDYFKKRNKSMLLDDALIAVDSLTIQSQDVNVDKLYLLIKKIESYVGAKTKVSKDDILTVCSQSKDFVIWNLFNSLDEKDIGAAFSLLNDLLMFSKSRESEIIQLMHSIQWKYSLLFLAKSGLAQGLSKKDICSRISKLSKLERKGRVKKVTMTIIKKSNKPVPVYSEGMTSRIFDSWGGRKPSLSCYSFNELVLINYTIKRALTKIRVGCTPNEMLIPIEVIFMTICGKVRNFDRLNILTSRNIVMLEDYYYYG